MHHRWKLRVECFNQSCSVPKTSSSRNVFLVLPAVPQRLHHRHHQRSTCVYLSPRTRKQFSASNTPVHPSCPFFYVSSLPNFCHSPFRVVLSVFFFRFFFCAFRDTYPLYLYLPSSLSLSTLSLFFLPRFLTSAISPVPLQMTV